MRYLICVGSVLLLLACSATLLAQTSEPQAADSMSADSMASTMPPPAPVTDLRAFDTPNDHGHSVTLEWKLSADDGAGANSVLRYDIYRWKPELFMRLQALRTRMDSLDNEVHSGGRVSSEMRDRVKLLEDSLYAMIDELPQAHAEYPHNGEWSRIGFVGAGISTYVNSGSKDRRSGDFIPDHTDFYYRVVTVAMDTTVMSQSDIVGPVQCYGQWFNTGRTAVFVAVLIFCALTMVFVSRARRGAELYVRPLAGIEAVDDAIGRATEMGRPILYVLGLGSAADVATIAAFTILGRVAKRVAEYHTPIIVPTYDPIVMSVAQEVVRSSYMDAGYPDEYDENSVFFVTNLQFAYVAAVNGIMLRQLPATNVYMGKFYAESLILAETGALAGSIQIAGTDEIAQIPFFIVACDYTLIGEELYAASAYLGREPILLGSLKAQDWAKAAVIVLAIIGIVAANLDWTAFTDLFHVTN